MPRKPKRRWLIWIVGVPALVLLTISGVVAVSLNAQVKGRLAEAIAAADRDDPNWRMADVVAGREKVPDAENAALIVDRVLEKLPRDWPAAARDPRPGFPKPPSSPAEDALERLNAIHDDVRLDENLAHAIRTALAEQAEALAIARTLADHPRGNRDIKFGRVFLDTLLPKTQATRAVGRLLQMDAALRAHDGDLDGALDSCRAIVNCGRSLGDEPTLISQLVRMSVVSGGVRSTQRVLAQGEPSDAAMASLQALVADESTVHYTLNGLRGERGGMDELIRQIASGELPVSALGEAKPAPGEQERRATVSPWGRALFENSRAVELEWMTDAVQISRKPDFEQFPLWDAWEDRMRTHSKLWHARYTATFPLLLTPACQAAVMAQARNHAEQAATSLMLAAERHRRKTGSWPASADAIEKTILGTSLIDPLNGKPLHMEARDGKLFAYSVGANGKDDHGSYNIRLWDRGPYDVGGTLWDVSLRRKPAPLPDLPENVFKTSPDEPNENP